MTDCLADQPVTRLAFLLSDDLEITPTTALNGDSDCDVCGEQPALVRVYGDPEPSWVFHAPFVYAEACLDCGAFCVTVAANQRSAVSGAIRVEVAADVWASREG
jgi:hypothetical protein